MCLGYFSLGIFSFVLRSVVGDNHSLMGGSGDAFASWPVVYFYLFVAIFCLFPDCGDTGFFMPTPWGVSQGSTFTLASNL